MMIDILFELPDGTTLEQHQHGLFLHSAFCGRDQLEAQLGIRATMLMAMATRIRDLEAQVQKLDTALNDVCGQIVEMTMSLEEQVY